jgi:Protein of unknown function (DUF2000)
MRFIVAVNQKFDAVVQCNAIGHLALGMSGICSRNELKLRCFYDSCKSSVSTMTDHPLIVFTARNSRHLEAAFNFAKEFQLPCNAFFDTMLSADPEEQASQIASRQVGELNFVAILVFGSKDALAPVTRQFSLMRNGQSKEAYHATP